MNYLNYSDYGKNIYFNCKFLPLCWGPCNQKQLESGTDLSGYCPLNIMGMDIEKFVYYKFNNRYQKMLR